MLDIFELFDRFCRMHDIKYFRIVVSLLESFRDEGFIPWDDDLRLKWYNM